MRPGSCGREGGRSRSRRHRGVSGTGDRGRGPGARPERAGPDRPREGSANARGLGDEPPAGAGSGYSAGGGDATPIGVA